MRLIDADAIFPWYVEAFKGEIEPHDVRFSMHDIEMNLSNIPTIDAIPVIRCKDCKHYKWEIDMCNLPGATVFPMNVVHEDDYCSRAERREENGK